MIGRLKETVLCIVDLSRSVVAADKDRCGYVSAKVYPGVGAGVWRSNGNLPSRCLSHTFLKLLIT